MHNLPLIYTPPPDTNGIFIIPPDEARHLTLVLRAKIGTQFIAFDGVGNGWLAQLVSLEQNRVTAKLINPIPPLETSKNNLTMVVSIIKGTRMDWAIEKCAELGVMTFIPLKTDFSVVEPGSQKIARWRNIALAATKQSRRFRVMEILKPIKLNELLTQFDKTTVWALDINDKSESFIKWIINKPIPNPLTILIGPEGGFSDTERRLFKQFNIPTFHLGFHPLRTETATTICAAYILGISY